jgi:phenylalanyl-tRNA synthetase alpha chain
MSTTPADPAAIRASIERAISTLHASFRARFEQATTEQALRDENAKVLGKKGELTGILAQMRALPPDDRKAIGELANALKRDVESAFEERLLAIHRAARAADLDAPPFDLTLPGRDLAPLGHAHPISIVRDAIVDVFRGLGFAVHDGPEVEREENNFGKLGFPPDHPATDMQDSFWTSDPGLLLRTHTSNVQIRAMTTHAPPMAFLGPGAVYRRDDDATHSPMFHQVEGFLVDEGVSMAHL